MVLASAARRRSCAPRASVSSDCTRGRKRFASCFAVVTVSMSIRLVQCGSSDASAPKTPSHAYERCSIERRRPVRASSGRWHESVCCVVSMAEYSPASSSRSMSGRTRAYMRNDVAGAATGGGERWVGDGGG